MRSLSASAVVLSRVPCSSSTTRRTPLGKPASNRCASAAMHCAAVLPLLRGSAFSAFSSSRISGGKRLAKSAQAVSAQAGWRWPTATTSSFISL